MKQPKNYLTLSLMISSLVLLVTLQGLWLRNSYDNAYDDFREETSRLFRTAVLAVRDSSLLESIEAIPPDGIDSLREFTFSSHIDTTIAFRRENHRRRSRMDGQVQVYLSPGAGFDSSKVMLRSIASQFHEGKLKGNSRFVIRMRPDSLSTDSISAQFSRALAKANKLVPFEVNKLNAGPPFSKIPFPRSGTDIIVGSESDELVHNHSFLHNTIRSEWVV
jgi:two-component system, OmpR family, phosphate regulon sensor histidine kinase PhoR